MTSGSFFLKNLKDQMKKNIPLMILLFLAFLAVLPINAVIRMEAAKGYSSDTLFYETMGESLRAVSYEFFRTVGTGNSLLIFVMIAAGILMALIHFSYLHSGEKMDFYHSLPIRRNDLFLVRTLGSVISVLIPYFFSLLLAYAAGAAYGAMTFMALKTSLIMTGFHLLYFLVFYETAALAVLLTGNLFTAVLGTVGLLVYAPALRTVQYMLNSLFFHTLSDFKDTDWEQFLSPLFAYSGIPVNIENQLPVGKYAVYGVVLAVLLAVLCLAVYKIRPSESYHRSIAFEKLQPVIKVAVVLPASLLLAVSFTGYMSSHKFLWFVASLAFCLLIFSSMVEFLYTMDIRKSLKPKTSTGVLAVLLGIIAVGYHVDVLGVDSYLPEKEKIESMSVYINSIEDKYRDSMDLDMKSTAALLKENRIENFDDIYKIAEVGVDYYKDKTEDDKSQNYYEEETMVSVYVGFHLTSGKNVYRRYLIPETEELTASVENIYNSWEYRQQVLPTSYIDFSKAEYLYTEDFVQTGEQVDAKGDAMENIYKTYKGELEGMTFAQASEERIIGYLCIREKENEDGIEKYYRLPVYENFDKTRELLEKAGSPMPVDFDVDEVLQIQLYNYKETGDNGGLYSNYKVTDTEELKVILKNLSCAEARYSIDSDYNYGYNVEIYWKDQDRVSDMSYILKDTPDTRRIMEKMAPENSD